MAATAVASSSVPDTVTIRIGRQQLEYDSPRNAYMLFHDANYNALRKKHPDEKFEGMAKRIGEAWRDLRENNPKEYKMYKDAEAKLKAELPPVKRKPKKARMTLKKRNKTLVALRKKSTATDSVSKALKNMTWGELKRVLAHVQIPLEKGATKGKVIAALDDAQSEQVIEGRLALLREALPQENAKKLNAFLRKFTRLNEDKKKLLAETIRTLETTYKKEEITYDELISYLSLIPHSLEYALDGIPAQPKKKKETSAVEQDAMQVDESDEQSASTTEDEDDSDGKSEPRTPPLKPKAKRAPRKKKEVAAVAEGGEVAEKKKRAPRKKKAEDAEQTTAEDAVTVGRKRKRAAE